MVNYLSALPEDTCGIIYSQCDPQSKANLCSVSKEVCQKFTSTEPWTLSNRLQDAIRRIFNAFCVGRCYGRERVPEFTEKVFNRENHKVRIIGGLTILSLLATERFILGFPILPLPIIGRTFDDLVATVFAGSFILVKDDESIRTFAGRICGTSNAIHCFAKEVIMFTRHQKATVINFIRQNQSPTIRAVTAVALACLLETGLIGLWVSENLIPARGLACR